MTKLFSVIKQAASEFMEDECLTSGAAIAYYAIFSLPPLLVVVFSLATFFGVSQDRINNAAQRQLGISDAVDPAETSEAGNQESSIQIDQVADRAGSTEFGGIGPFGRIIGLVVLIFAATGFFAQLQLAINRAWDAAPQSTQGAVTR